MSNCWITKVASVSAWEEWDMVIFSYNLKILSQFNHIGELTIELVKPSGWTGFPGNIEWAKLDA
jgi:hypothetical protein